MMMLWVYISLLMFADVPPQALDLEAQSYHEMIISKQPWLVRYGDNIQWAMPDVPEDEHFKKISPVFEFSIPEDSVFWARLWLDVPESKFNSPAYFKIQQFGVSEIYLNGQKVYEVGTFTTYPEKFKYNSPEVVYVGIELGDQPRQLLSVRYAVLDESLFLGRLTSQDNLDSDVRGFKGTFGPAVQNLWTSMQFKNMELIHQYFFIGLFLIIFITHFTLAWFKNFDPVNTNYAFSALSFFILYFFSEILIGRLDVSILDTYYYQIFVPLLIIGVAQLSLTIQSLLTETHFFRVVWLYLGLYLIIITSSVLYHGEWMFYVAIAMFPVLMLVIIVQVLLFLKKLLKTKPPGYRILMIGYATFGISIPLFLYVLIVEEPFLYSYELLFMVFISSIPIALTIYLAATYSINNRELSNKYKEIREINEKLLVQEKKSSELKIKEMDALHKAQTSELQARVLESEQEMKRQEISEARNLQLAMMPDSIPENDLADIQWYLHYSREMGGGFLDAMQNNGSLKIFAGKANSKGYSAGLMLAMLKSAIYTSEKQQPAELFTYINKTIMRVHQGSESMDLCMVELQKDGLRISNSGNIHIHHLNADASEIQEISLHQVPIAQHNNTTYKDVKIPCGNGDVLLITSGNISMERYFKMWMEKYRNDTSTEAVEKISEVIKSFKQEDEFFVVWIKIK